MVNQFNNKTVLAQATRQLIIPVMIGHPPTYNQLCVEQNETFLRLEFLSHRGGQGHG